MNRKPTKDQQNIRSGGKKKRNPNPEFKCSGNEAESCVRSKNKQVFGLDSEGGKQESEGLQREPCCGGGGGSGYIALP